MQKPIIDATTKGGIPGYCNEWKLTMNEDGLLSIYVSMGTSNESAHQIFCVGPNSIKMLLGNQDNESIGKLVVGVNKIQSPEYPDKTKVYHGPRFAVNLDTFVS